MFNWKYANYLVCKLVNSLHISIIIQLAFTIHNITSKRPSVYTMHAVNREFSLQYYFCNFQGKIHTRKYWTAVNIFFKEHTAQKFPGLQYMAKKVFFGMTGIWMHNCYYKATQNEWLLFTLEKQYHPVSKLFVWYDRVSNTLGIHLAFYNKTHSTHCRQNFQNHKNISMYEKNGFMWGTFLWCLV